MQTANQLTLVDTACFGDRHIDIEFQRKCFICKNDSFIATKKKRISFFLNLLSLYLYLLERTDTLFV